MIFADIEYSKTHSDMHQELVMFVSDHFSKVKFGLQGDSWIWVFDDDVTVEIDTFSSMRHQVKSKNAGAHVQRVIAALQLKYKLKIYETPELEANEDD